ncbi:MAG: sulfatase-like hydrolase/transferase [Planctomycetota bacterium]|jgi:arylsulfatase A-like enzyme/Flp pilus assembly protein TadD
MTRKPLILVTVLAFAVVAAAALLAWAGWWARGTPSAKPNILLVTFDTTRADRIGAYGWRHARTAAWDRLAAEGVVFDRAVAPVPLTLPSHAAMLTGLYPFANGVRDNSHFVLDKRARTVAEALGEQGYQTCAVVAAFVLDHRFGLDQGFDDYRDEIPGRAEFERLEVPARNAQAVVDDAIDWLRGADSNRPFFLWCHFYDPHHPYLTPASFPFYLSHPYDQEIAFADHHLQRLLDEVYQRPPNDAPTVVVATADHGEGLGEHGEETHGYFVYESTLHVPLVIRYPDGAHAGTRIETPVSVVDIMPTALELAGLTPPAGNEIHGRSLLGLFAGGRAEAEAYRDRPVYFECYSPSYAFGWAPLRGVRVGQHKYIESPIEELYLLHEDPAEGLGHNVAGQNPQAVARLTRVLRDLVDQPLLATPLESTVESLDAEVIQRLRALGYLAAPTRQEPTWDPQDDLKSRLSLYNKSLRATEQIGAGETAAGVGLLLEVLEADPDNPRCLWLLAEAVATDPHAAEEGLAVLEAVARDPKLDPGMRAPFLINCGRARLIVGQPRLALEHFREAAEIEPDTAANWSWVCVAHVHLGEAAEALEAARKAADRSPDTAALAVQLGLLQIINGDLDEGANTWSRVLARSDRALTAWDIAGLCANDPRIANAAFERLHQVGTDRDQPALARAAARAATGQILLSAGRYGPALAALEEAGSLWGDDDTDGLWLRCRALIYLGRLGTAEQLLRRAHASDRHDIRIVVDLANVCAQQGRGEEAVELLLAYYEGHSDDPTASNNLAWMLAEHGDGEQDLDRALELSKFATARRPSSAAFADTLGRVHLTRRDGESAVAALARAVKLQPDNAAYQYHLGRAYRLDGRPDAAREAFAAAVRLAPTPRPSWFDDAVEGAAPE